MRLLAIDTSLNACSVCLLDAARPELLLRETSLMERGHAEALMPMVARIASQASGEANATGLNTIDRIAVTIGPGSYTGLRIGISAARAIGLALSKPVVGVTTLAALAAPSIGREPGRLITAAIDARHGCVYVTVLNSDGKAVIAPRLASIKDAARAIGAGPASLVGSGAKLVAQEAWAMGLDVVVVEGSEAPDILWVARLGMLTQPQEQPPRPLYLRAPEATAQDGAHIARQ
ncbi:MAG: tRNA (adenosine(37)-N6)-threonylcarbamoyltransferase complex dimerization subunit type 1 TsaB [Bosea sp. (in: a-proteobacteria)]